MSDEPDNPRRAVCMFADEIERVIDYYRREFQLGYGEAIGALHVAAHKLTAEALGLTEESEDEDLDD